MVEQEEDTLHSFLCPITQVEMVDPVILENGQTYERKAIETWFQSHDTDPMTNMQINKRKFSNIALRGASEEFHKKHKEMKLELKQHKQWRITQEEQWDVQNVHWLEKLLQRKRNFAPDSNWTQDMQYWSRCFSGHTAAVINIVATYIEEMTLLDSNRQARVQKVLGEAARLPTIVADLILYYAEQNVDIFGKRWIRHVISRYQHFEQCTKNWWNSTVWSKTSLQRAFQRVVDRNDSFSRRLCAYVDTLLTSQIAPPGGHLEFSVALYDALQEKDVFETHYRLLLMDRLVSKTFTIDREKKMIQLLSRVGGYQWTNKLQKMVWEVENPMFVPKQASNIDVIVASSGYWPLYLKTPFHAPKELAESMACIKKEWMMKNNGTTLIWQMHLGRAEVDICMTCSGNECDANRHYTFNVTTYQMMILLLFNEKQTLTYQEILDGTIIPKSDIQHHLLSLVHPKVAILVKLPNTQQLSHDTQFQLNNKYVNAKKVVRVPLMFHLATRLEIEDEETKTRNMQRQHQMDSTIVCIMMTRGKMQHALLIAEVISRLKPRFMPKPANIKKRIEALIQQEYLERDSTDRDVYNCL